MDREKKSRYNDDWVITSYNIRVKRAANRCEKCGLLNDSIIKRFKDGLYRPATQEELTKIKYYHEQLHNRLLTAIKLAGLVKIHLTVAHLNHNERDDRPGNLLCACARCHLLYDKQDNAIRARIYKAKEATQLRLL